MVAVGRVFAWLLIVLTIPVTHAHAQQYTISGYVEDATSRERIPGASVFIPTLQLGTTTNQFGFYSLTTVESSFRLMVSHVGYTPASSQIELRGDTTLIVTLLPRVIDLEEIEVTANGESSLDAVQMSSHEIPIEDIETLPIILGETDIQKALQLLPSVQSGVEGSSGLYVRGGRADQNLILLDGLPVYNPSHLFGFFSVFNPTAMKRVELIKGGFPARYGGRLSSVVNYTMKEGNLRRFAGEASIGLISSRALLEGPIKKDRASFLLAGRRTYLDQLLRPFQLGRTRFGAAFYDMNFKANYAVSERNHVYLSGYAGKDDFFYQRVPVPGRAIEDEFRYELGWLNRLASLRWNRQIGDRLFSNFLLGVTHYRFFSSTHGSDKEDNSEFEQSWHSEIADWTAKLDLEFIPNPQHYVRFGAEGIVHRFSPGTTSTRLDEAGRRLLTLLETPAGMLTSKEIALYAEDDIRLHRAVRMSAGLRLSGYIADRSQFGSFEPRLGVNVRLNKSTALKASFARSNQYVHLLAAGAVALPTDLWIPSMERIRPQSGHQLAAGFFQTYLNGRYELAVEGYLKRMKGLVEYKMGMDRFRTAFLDWPDLLEEGMGTAHGAEIFFQKRRGRLTGWLGYTMAKATRRFESLNGGRQFADGYDRRHDVSLVMQYNLSSTRQVSAVWVYGSGYPVWAPVGRYVGSGGSGLLAAYYYPHHIVEPGPVNSARAPAYHRLDLSVQFRKELSWGERTISLGLYNAYNRKNPMFVYPKLYSEGHSLISFQKLSLLQLIPAISIKWRF